MPSHAVRALPKPRVTIKPFRTGSVRSSDEQGVPPNSQATRLPVTVSSARACLGSSAANAAAVATPWFSNRAAKRLPMPHTSPTGIIGSSRSRSSGERRSQTPLKRGCFFATKFASFARVFVGPTPTQVGMPVHCRTRARKVRARSGMSGNPVKSRKNSSIEYGSTSGASESSVSWTRRLRSPYKV